MNNNLKKPKEVFAKVFKRGLFVQLAFMCYIYSTTSSSFLIVAHLIGVLTFLMLALIALWCALHVEAQNHAQWLYEHQMALHYPENASFQQKVEEAERIHRRYHRGVNEYA